MSYEPNGSAGLNDFAEQISGAPDHGDSITTSAVILASAVYRVGAEIVDNFDNISSAIWKLAEEVELLRNSLPDQG